MKILLLIFLVLSFSGIIAQNTEQWAFRYNGTGDYSENIHCMIFDNSGSLYLSGYTVNIGQRRDFLLIKMNSSGDTLWTRTFNGPDDGNDEVNAMAVDSFGNIILTGFQKGNNTGNDFLTIKYNSSGDTLWTRVYNYSANEDDASNSVAVDQAGNVFVTGQSDGNATVLENDDYVTIKYSSSGLQEWVQRFNGTGNNTDRSVKILSDASGNVVVTGRSFNIYGDDDYVSIKYNSSGVQQWLARYDSGSGDDRAVGMVTDVSNNVYVVGRSSNGTSDDYVTVKYNSAGAEQWVKIYDGAGAGHDRPSAITIDASANIYVTGQSDIDPTINKNYNYLTVKYNSAGVQLWAVPYNGTGNGEDIPTSIYVDVSGNVFVTGESDSDPSSVVSNKDYLTVKYNSSGSQQWTRTYFGNASLDDKANVIIGDISGNVIISGAAKNTFTQKDILSIKYNSLGTAIWIKTNYFEGDNSDNVNDIATDASGNIYLAGYSVNTDTSRDICIAKISAAGDTLWMKKFNGLSGDNDEATAIKVDVQGYVYVTGYTKNSGTSYDFTTIKLKSAGDTLWLRKYNAPYNESDKAWALDVDVDGNVYVTGESDSDISDLSNDDFCTVKYNSSGVFQWAVRYNGTGNVTDRAVALKAGTSGNIYITGRSYNGLDDDYVTIKYNSSGSQQWIKTYNSGNGNDQPKALCVDGNENVYVTGSGMHIGELDEDFVTVKYNLAGDQQWIAIYNGIVGENDKANDIVADENGNVFVTGETDVDASDTVKNYNYLTVKYDANGNEKWYRDYNGLADGDDEAKAIFIDDSSNVFITGQSDNGNSNFKNNDFVTIKYDSTGTLRWIATYNGTGNGSDGANAIEVKNNIIYVAGGSWGSGSQKDMVLLKYQNIYLQEESTITSDLLEIFPNPASNQIFIKNMNGFRNNSIRICNTKGQPVKEISGISACETVIDVSDLKSGFYVVSVNNLFYKKIEIINQ